MYARAEVLDQVDYSLNVSKQCMAFFKDFFGVDYPLPKSGAFLFKLKGRFPKVRAGKAKPDTLKMQQAFSLVLLVVHHYFRIWLIWLNSFDKKWNSDYDRNGPACQFRQMKIALRSRKMIKSQSDLHGNFSNAFIVSSDGIGLPVFGPAGMENWGLIKYRETGVLVKEGETSSSSREGIARLVAHEVAHLVKPVLSVL